MKTLAVILPTYNAAPYIKTAIDSILSQSFSDFDLYIFDDCSIDETKNIVNRYGDSRVFYRKNDKNYGIAKTLNLAISLLEKDYQYLARMDADDWAFPQRFDKQIQYLNANPDVVLCGTQGYWLTDFNKMPSIAWTHPESHDVIRVNLLFAASFGHSSIMFRSDFLIKNAIRYDENVKTCEDWELWTRITQVGKVANLNEFLMKYRIVDNSNHRSETNSILHFKERSKVIAKHWCYYGIDFTEHDVFSYYYSENLLKYADFKEQLKRLIDALNLLFYNISIDHDLNTKQLQYILLRFLRRYIKQNQKKHLNLKTLIIVCGNLKFAGCYKILKNIIIT